MLTFFDYLFYKACEFYYKEEGKNSSFRTSGLLIVAVVQGFNLFAIFFIICIIIHEKINVNKYYAVLPVLILLVLNGIRYNRDEYDYNVLQEKWGSQESKTRKRKQNLVIAYIIFSTMLFFGLAAYLGSKKW
jgi:hypothetical protein